MYEALQRLRFEAFLDTLDDEYQESIFSLIETMQDSLTEGKSQEYMKGQLFDDIIMLQSHRLNRKPSLIGACTPKWQVRTFSIAVVLLACYTHVKST